MAKPNGDTPVPNWRQPMIGDLSPILASALDAFYENGYHGTSVRDIAQQAGMTVPGLYYHYDSKQSILLALLDHSITSVIEFAEAAVADSGDQFDNLIEALLIFVARHVKHAAMDNEIRALTPENRRRYSARRRVVEHLLVAIIEKGVAQGRFRVDHPRDTARALLGMIQSVSTWFRPGGRMSATAVAQRYLDVARRAVLADTAAAAPLSSKRSATAAG